LGNVVSSPLYEHETTLDFIRFELSLEYTFVENWDVWLRVPYEIKSQRVGYTQVEPVSIEDVLNQRRHVQAHHRTETYEGLSDLMVLVAPRWTSVITEGDVLTLAWGFTLPTGQTERDSVKKGRAGEKHLHIQFGSGTVDPLLEAYYAAPLPLDFGVSGFVNGRFPFYENPKTYRASLEITSGLRCGYSITPWLNVGAELTLFWQSPAYWDGTRDPNSGLITLLGGVGVVLNPGAGFMLTLGGRLPLVQQSLSSEEDTFEQGLSLSASVSWTGGL